MIESKNGKAEFLMRTGADFVLNKMDVGEAKKIIDKGDVTRVSQPDGFTICVDDKFFFKPSSKSKKKVT